MVTPNLGDALSVGDALGRVRDEMGAVGALSFEARSSVFANVDHARRFEVEAWALSEL